MPQSLRILTAVIVAQLLVAGVMIAFRDAALPGVDVYAPTLEGPRTVTIPVPVLALSVVSFIISVTYILAGLFHSAWPFRLAGLGLLTIGIGLEGRYSGGAGLFQSTVCYLLLGLVWLVGLWTLVRDYLATHSGGNRPTRGRDIDMRLYGLLAALMTSLLLVGWLRLHPFAGVLSFASRFAVDLSFLSVILTPMLFLAGLDITDFGQVGASHAAEAVRRRATSVLLVVVTAGVAVAEVLPVPNLTHGRLAMAALLVLVIAGVVAAGGTRRSTLRLPRRVPMSALAASAFALFVVFTVPMLPRLAVPQTTEEATSATRSGSEATAMNEYKYSQEPGFSISYSRNMTPTVFADDVSKGYTWVDFFTGLPKGTGSTSVESFVKHYWNFDVLSFKPSGPTADGTLIGQVFLRQSRLIPTFSSSPQEGPWATASLDFRGHPGKIWSRVIGDRMWLFYFSSRPEAYGETLLQARAMRDSWKPTASSPPAGETVDGSASAKTPRAIAAGLWLGIAVAAAGIYVLLVRRRGGGSVAAVALFAMVSGVWFFLIEISDFAQVAFGASPDRIPHAGLPHLQAIIGVVSLAVLGWLVMRRPFSEQARRTIALLLTLNVSLQITAWFFDLYSGVQIVSERIGIAQALVIVGALMYDLVLSGEITNGGGRLIPRHARVSIFLGYIAMVISALVYYSTLHMNGTGVKVAQIFDTEVDAQFGLSVVGIPLVLTLFILSLLHGRSSTASHVVTQQPFAAGRVDENRRTGVRDRVPVVVPSQAASASVWRAPRRRAAFFSGLIIVGILAGGFGTGALRRSGDGSRQGRASDTTSSTGTTAAELGTLDVSPREVTMVVGQFRSLDVRGTLIDGTAATAAELASLVTWKSSNAAVVAATAGGSLTAVGAGRATVTAASQEQTVTVAVNVNTAPSAKMVAPPPTSTVPALPPSPTPTASAHADHDIALEHFDTGFENSYGGFTTTSADALGSVTFQLVHNSSQAKEGTWYAEVSTSRTGQGISKDVHYALIEGKTYIVSMFVRSANGAPVHGRLYTDALGNSIMLSAPNAFVANGNWTRISASLVVRQSHESILEARLLMDTVNTALDVDVVTFTESS